MPCALKWWVFINAADALESPEDLFLDLLPGTLISFIWVGTLLNFQRGSRQGAMVSILAACQNSLTVKSGSYLFHV